MDVKAKLRFLRMSPKKVRLVIDVIRGMDAEEAQTQLQFVNKRAAKPVLKLLNSAIANALNNSKLKKENLYIKKITADDGPTLKRWKPRAFGRAAEIRKRSTHVTIVLGEYKETPKKKLKEMKKKELAKKEKRPVVGLEDIKREAKGKEETQKKPQEQKKKSFLSFKKIKEKFTRRLGER